jgi:hypothetical protein
MPLNLSFSSMSTISLRSMGSLLDQPVITIAVCHGLAFQM